MILKLYIFATLLFYCYCRNKNKALGWLLFLSVLNTVLSDVLWHYGEKAYINNNLYIFLHQLIWLLLIRDSASNKGKTDFMLLFYVAFSLVSTCYYNPVRQFNFGIFILGALFYLMIFVFESYSRLKGEKLSFFLSNHYLLLFAPVLFFLGMSLMFNFRSRSITKIVLYQGLTLYDIVSYFVNAIYYSFVNLYLYKEKNLRNAS